MKTTNNWKWNLQQALQPLWTNRYSRLVTFLGIIISIWLLTACSAGRGYTTGKRPVRTQEPTIRVLLFAENRPIQLQLQGNYRASNQQTYNGTLTINPGQSSSPANYGIQLGSFSQKANAERFCQNYTDGWVRFFSDKNVYSVFVGKFATHSEAKTYLQQHTLPQGAFIKSLPSTVSTGNVTVQYQGQVQDMNFPWILTPLSDASCRVENGKEQMHVGGELIVHMENGQLILVNQLPLEQYLLGVVPAEIGSSSPMEALKAQTIAARSIASYFLENSPHPSSLYDVCATTHCQKYVGLQSISQGIRQAVEATRGEILVYENQPINAVYHSSSCGYTENNENIWGGNPVAYLRGKYDGKGYYRPLTRNQSFDYWLKHPPKTYDNPDYAQLPSWTQKYFRWERSFSHANLEAKANRLKSIGHLLRIEVEKRGVSGRVLALKISGSQSHLMLENEYKIRQFFDHLPSSAFTIGRQGSGWLIEGTGFGHGVGMNQTGAIGRANKGQSYRQIVQFYYSGASLKRLY